MDRTVPKTGSEEIELYIRTYYSLLRSTTDVRIRSLEEVHAQMGSSLHLSARSTQPDTSALIYTSLRLPACIVEVDRVVLGQSPAAFQAWGIGDVESWQPVAAKARRRRSFYDGEHTLACYIGSGSDIDDMVPILTGYQIEWNKLHHLLRGDQVKRFLQEPLDTEEGLAVLARGLGIESENLLRLREAWGERFWETLRAIAARRKDFRIRLLAGSLRDYRQATQIWWERIERAVPDISARPAYFVSSNAHSIVNLIYYVLKKYVRTPEGAEALAARAEAERACGITRVPSEHGFDVEAQVVDLQGLKPAWLDPRLRIPGVERLAESEALIVNIDYPLGMAAYLILSQASTRFGELRGVYIMGKAATLNGVIGDVMIPSVVHDEGSKNTYLFDNCFRGSDIQGHLVYGTVLDNQKAVSVRGTFLQTPRYMDVFYREGYTDIEMEAGPYLSAVYEIFRPKRYPTNEIVNLYDLPFDLGILHYASDTPLSKGSNLGAGSLSYFGVDPTYATSVAILRRIFTLEAERT